MPPADRTLSCTCQRTLSSGLLPGGNCPLDPFQVLVGAVWRLDL